ncbi:hypothetical protein LUZ61_018676 [Rhynchospora tenuis]|uniref:Uncharacterized protein n=1 Tax=Rhynchospora tenuis TaxID=198213 RepID=A0AAD5Z9P2_9POAL|nr:hypothetical protein LUZ61_018676 [Rhynchospora tenuis]
MEIRKEEAIALAFQLFLVSPLLALSAASAPPHNEAPTQRQDLDVPSVGVDHSDFKLQLDHLRSQILTLESIIDDRTKELKYKDRAISNLDKTIQQKSENIVSLQNDIASLQKKLPFDVASKANAKTILLEEQIDALKKEIESQKKKRNVLEIQLIVAEYETGELSAKLKSIQKTSDEQKKWIKETEYVLKVAEEELMRARLETSVLQKQLHEVHGAWLPPWLATELTFFMEVMCDEWNEYGIPMMASFIQMATEKSKAQKWAEPHLETAKTKWMLLKTNTEPYIQLAWSKSAEWYETAEIITAPHITKFQEVTSPHIQKVLEILELYIDRSAELSEAYVEKLIVLMLLSIETYTSFLESATTYYRQAQANIGEYLNKHELAKKLATKEHVWLMASASALLALIFFLYCILSQLFCMDKPRKQIRSSHGNHRARRHKRRNVTRWCQFSESYRQGTY